MADYSSIPDEAARRLKIYVARVRRWSSHINLTGAATEDEIFDTLVRPVLGAQDLIRNPLIDVGSGNGSPGLVLAALCPDFSITLLEPRAKRWAFLRDTARDMGLPKVNVQRLRSDDYEGPAARTITMRAVGLDPQTLKTHLLPGGFVLVFGGPVLAGAEKIHLPGGGVQRVCFT